MFGKIIIGIDHVHGPHGVGVAARLSHALAPTAEVVLAVVIPFAHADEPGELRATFERSARYAALTILERARDQIAMPAAQLRVVSNPSPADGLRALAADEHADLLILGAAHHGLVGRVLLGDVAHDVLSDAPCPVLVTAREHPRGDASIARIGVAFDCSPEAEQALDVAVGLSEALHAHLEVIHALDVGLIPTVGGTQIAKYVDSEMEPAREALEVLVRDLDVEGRGDVVQGAPHEALAAASARLDLLICGSRASAPHGRLAIGGTVERLMHEAQTAVLVVPRAREGAAAMRRGAEAQPSSVRRS